jgi:hypothetical protein
MSVALVDVLMSHQRSSLMDAGLGLVGPTPRGMERQVAPSLASFRASAVANNTNPTGRRRDSAKSSPQPIAPCRATATASLRRQPSPARAMR